MSSPPVILILGGGPRVGSSVARKFASEGYKVAIASRSLSDESISPEGYLQLRVDLSAPSGVPRVFEATRARFGTPPCVVVYNGALRIPHPPDEPFSHPLETVKTTLAVGFESLYVAVQEALKGFAELPAATPKTFIFTGNALNQLPIPIVFPFAASKTAAAMLVQYAANAYGEKGYRFYYADERKAPDGRPAVEDLDGEAHGEMYWELVQPGEQGKWLVTFSKGIGRAEYSAVNVDGTPYRPRY